MTLEHMAVAMELALYRVGDRWRHHSDPGLIRIGNVLREVADEFHKIVDELANEKTRSEP